MPMNMERFWSKIDVRGPDECWVWKGGLVLGYGQFWYGHRKRDYAHRISYKALVGDIPVGLVIDHLCRNRACVNPAHLEVVTERVNILRGTALSARYAVATHCIHGHEFTAANIIPQKNGARKCRACANEIGRKYRLQGGEARSSRRPHKAKSASSNLAPAST